MRQIEQSVWLDATPEAAYDYATSPRHWRHWYAGIVAVEVEGHADVP